MYKVYLNLSSFHASFVCKWHIVSVFLNYSWFTNNNFAVDEISVYCSHLNQNSKLNYKISYSIVRKVFWHTLTHLEWTKHTIYWVQLFLLKIRLKLGCFTFNQFLSEKEHLFFKIILIPMKTSLAID